MPVNQFQILQNRNNEKRHAMVWQCLAIPGNATVTSHNYHCIIYGKSQSISGVADTPDGEWLGPNRDGTVPQRRQRLIDLLGFLQCLARRASFLHLQSQYQPNYQSHFLNHFIPAPKPPQPHPRRFPALPLPGLPHPPTP